MLPLLLPGLLPWVLWMLWTLRRSLSILRLASSA